MALLNAGQGSGYWRFALLWMLCLLVPAAIAQPQGAAQAAAAEEESESPWLLAPTISSNPKVGTSLGFMGGYLFKIDEESTSSMTGLTGSYSDTDSFTVAAFLRSYWDADRKRLTAVIAGGNIKNDYDDYLGSGLPAQTTDDMKMVFARYLHAVHTNWFIGVQGVYTNYLIGSDNFTTQQILQAAGLIGFDAAGLGLVGMYDSRDQQNSPTSGKYFIINNFAFREGLGGDSDFDAYNAEFKHYLPHGEDSVLAYHFDGRWTNDAPASGYSSIDMRGYTRGQYLAPNSVMLEAEERWRINSKIGVHLFAGIACLYGDDKDCTDRDNIYTSGGIGAEYMIKASENMVITVDYAIGEGDNSGFYMRFGQAF